MIRDPSDEEVNWGHSSRLTHSPCALFFFRALNTKIPKTEKKCLIEGSSALPSVEFLFFSLSSSSPFCVHGMWAREEVTWKPRYFTQSHNSKFMVLWPEASNNGNCFRREHFYRPILSWGEGDANKLSFLSAACFVYWSNTVSTRNSSFVLQFSILFFRYKKLSALNWYFFLKHPIWWQLNYFAKIKHDGSHFAFWLKCFKFQVPFSIYFFHRLVWGARCCERVF